MLMKSLTKDNLHDTMGILFQIQGVEHIAAEDPEAALMPSTSKNLPSMVKPRRRIKQKLTLPESEIEPYRKKRKMDAFDYEKTV